MPDFSLEDRARTDGFRAVAGVDEAGRGPWAGPVVAGAVLFDRARVGEDLLARLDDSKKLSAARREAAFQALQACDGVAIGVGVAERDEIDALNILRATMLAMTRAVAALPVRPEFVLVDGTRTPELAVPASAVKKGDGISLSIAAASIVAKVTRDDIMADLSRDWPGYGWERNAGYGTAEHQAALRKLGVTPHHRMSFRPVRELAPGSPS